MTDTPSIYDDNWFTDANQLSPKVKEGLGQRSTADVSKARAIVADFRRGSKQAFSHLDRGKVADVLDARLSDPNSFNQAHTWLCGIATFVRVWAFDHPVEYVKLAVNLFESGSGRLEGQAKYAGKPIVPSNALKNCPPGLDMPQADWIVLASIREAFNNVWGYTNDEGIFHIKAWNFPADVVNEFRAAGYTRIRNKANWTAPSGYDNLMEASDLYDSDWRVILLINDRLLDDKQIKGPGVINTSNHWVGLDSDVIVTNYNGKQMLQQFDVYSWSGRITVPNWKEPKEIPLATFNACYFGFVAGHV
jgi:hypothetical protein